MANATKITLRALTENTPLDQPTADVLDTGTTAVTLPLTPIGQTNRILLEFTNTAQADDDMAVKVKAGVNPPAFQNGLGDLDIVLEQNDVVYVVVESARFMQADGDIDIVFTPAATKTQTATVRAFVLPK